MALKSRIDKLINSLGGGPRLSDVDFRAELICCGELAQALENEQSTLEAEAKITALEKEVESLEAQITDLNGERGMLKTQLELANAEIAKAQTQHANKSQNDGQRQLDEIAENILLVLQDLKAGHEPQAGHIAHAINANQALVAHWLVKLDGKGLVLRIQLYKYARSHTRTSADEDFAWAITTEGTDYLIERKLWGQPTATGVETVEANTEQQKTEIRVLEILLEYKWQSTRAIQERLGLRTIEKAELLLKRMERDGLIFQIKAPWLHDEGPGEGDWQLADKGTEKLDAAGLL